VATLATPQADRDAIAAFRRDVIESSMRALVLVDFWAEWCGPCKTLGPILERVVATYAPRVKLVKVDIDKNQLIAQQFRIQSVPTVYAFIGGQPVDGFAGAVGERELKAFIDRLLAAAPPGGPEEAENLEPLIESGNQALAAGEFAAAEEVFGALSEAAPEDPAIAAGLARALTGLGRADDAAAVLAALPEAAAKDAAVQQARAAIELARQAGPAGDLARLRAAAEAAPGDLEAGFAYAQALVGAGQRDLAADELLRLIALDRGWNDGSARDLLLKLFEAQGLADPWTVAQRRRLSAILFA